MKELKTEEPSLCLYGRVDDLQTDRGDTEGDGEMRDAKEYCTCTDYKCPCHPVNHDQGCNLCILKNLKQQEIPSCFFHDIDCEKPTGNWHYQDFAALVEKAEKEGKL